MPSSDWATSGPDAQDDDDDEPTPLDTINDAVNAVKAIFPQEATLLADLVVDSVDDEHVYLTAVIGGTSDGRYDHRPIDACICEQFESFGISQSACVSLQPLSMFLATSDADDGAAADDSNDHDSADDD